jgi:hypothetical protein
MIVLALFFSYILAGFFLHPQLMHSWFSGVHCFISAGNCTRTAKFLLVPSLYCSSLHTHSFAPHITPTLLTQSLRMGAVQSVARDAALQERVRDAEWTRFAARVSPLSTHHNPTRAVSSSEPSNHYHT